MQMRNVDRAAIRVVAASNSSRQEKKTADYVCDGLDDQVQINAAIDALSTDGGQIRLLGGTFSIGAPVSFTRSKVNLSGQGASTILARAADNIHVIRVDNTGGEGSRHPCPRCNALVFETDSKCAGCGTDLAKARDEAGLKTRSQRTSFLNIECLAIDGNKDVYKTPCPEVLLTGVAKSVFNRLYGYRCHEGIRFANIAADWNFYNRVTDCCFEECTYGITAHDAHGLAIRGCLFREGGVGIKLEASNQASIVNCSTSYMKSPAEGSIHLDGCQFPQVLGGYFACGGYGKYSALFRNCNGLIASGATFFDSGGAGLTLQNCRNSTIDACQFEGNVGHGMVLVQSERTVVRGVVFSGNSYDQPNHYSGLMIEGSTHTTVNDCVFDAYWRNSGSPRHKYGVEESGSDYTIIRGCHFRENLSGTVSLAGAHSSVRD